MGSFSDLSQISDIHSISRISRVNCSRIFGRLDSFYNLSEHQNNLTSNASRNNIYQGGNHLEKTVKYLASCEESIGDYAKNKLILECIKEASLNRKGTLSDNVITKLKGLISMYELNKYMHLPSTTRNLQEKLSILGITDLPKYELSYVESLDIKCYVEALLRQKIHGFILRYEQLGGNVKEVLRSTDCNMRKKLFESYNIQILQWKDKIEELCAQYSSDIERCKGLISKWNNFKHKDMNCIYLEKAEYILLQAQVAEVQAKITKLSCIIRMYKETPITIDAYRTLNAVIDEKLFGIINEVKEKGNLKKQYESLQSTEYNEILKAYLHFCKVIKKKKQILEKF